MCLLCRLQHDSPNAQATLNVQSAGHVLRAFVNGNFVGKPFFFFFVYFFLQILHVFTILPKPTL